jgi:hypothetical protein
VGTTTGEVIVAFDQTEFTFDTWNVKLEMSWIGLIGMSGKKKNEPSVSSPESLKFDE